MNEATVRHQKKKAQAGSFLAAVGACLVLAIVIIFHVLKVHHLKSQLADSQKQLTQAKADDAQNKTDLDKARSQAADLQSQLDKTKSHQGDLQAQLDQAKEATNLQQGQIDKAKADAADLQSRLDKAKAQSADLQGQVNQANAGSAQLVTQLDQAKIQSMDLQTRLQKAESDITQLQPLLLRARHLPVTTSFEKHGDRAYTLHVKNLYLQPMSVDITISGTGETRNQSNVIGGGGTLNVDKLAAGDNVVIASDGYDSVNITVQ
jgi:septal ring factor EnvC (AmiA/AmiB activator)